MSAPKDNQNARKDDADKADGQVMFRCQKSQKGHWVFAANKAGLKLTEFMVLAANKLADELLANKN